MAEPQKRTARPAAAPAAGSPARALIDDLARRLAAEAARPSVAVLLPCYNEAATIGATVAAFRAALPEATVYVYDNNSTDGTAEAAGAAGAVVRHEPFQGKGNVVRRMFADVDADIYVMADGDMTYDPTAAPGLVDLLLRDQLDMVVGARVDSEEAAYRRGHRFGNAMFNRITTTLFGSPFKDIFSGYRVFSRRFAKSFPASSSGFEIEAELTVHAIDLKLRTGEVPLPYGKRPENSHSKLKTYRDGQHVPRGAAAALLRPDCRRAGHGEPRPRRTDHPDLSRNRPRAALPHRHPVGGGDAARLPHAGLRPRGRCGLRRAAGDEAHALSRPAGARLRAARGPSSRRLTIPLRSL